MTDQAQSLIIAPSILSANFAQLGVELQRINQSGANWIHIDVMDGHFVPNLTFGPPVIKALRPYSTLLFDVHLMIENPEDSIEAYHAAGADLITVHAEACVHLHRVTQQIRSLGAQVGVSLNPHTPISSIEAIIHDIDLVLLMSVNPGFGGQKFIPYTLEKIRQLSELRTQRKAQFKIEVDGGVSPSNAKSLVDAGADVFVAGSAIFKHQELSDGVRALRDAAYL